MGMNIYTIKPNMPVVFDENGRVSDALEDKHIGKRFANGIWCWDCRVPLFDKQRMEEVSFESLGNIKMPKQLDKCPQCGNSRVEEDEGYQPAMRELGFDKSEPTPHTGIDGASGFVWCLDSTYGLGESVKEVRNRLATMTHVVTEYGELWTMDDFNKMFMDVIEEEYTDGQFS